MAKKSKAKKNKAEELELEIIDLDVEESAEEVPVEEVPYEQQQQGSNPVFLLNHLKIFCNLSNLTNSATASSL